MSIIFFCSWQRKCTVAWTFFYFWLLFDLCSVQPSRARTKAHVSSNFNVCFILRCISEMAVCRVRSQVQGKSIYINLVFFENIYLHFSSTNEHRIYNYTMLAKPNGKKMGTRIPSEKYKHVISHVTSNTISNTTKSAFERPEMVWECVWYWFVLFLDTVHRPLFRDTRTRLWKSFEKTVPIRIVQLSCISIAKHKIINAIVNSKYPSIYRFNFFTKLRVTEFTCYCRCRWTFWKCADANCGDCLLDASAHV